MRRRVGGALVSFAVIFTSTAVGADADELGPPISIDPAALRCSNFTPDNPHEPVLLVHGTGATAEENWGWSYQPALEDLGYDVCTVDLPSRALGDIQVSSEYVVYAIRTIAAGTGKKVDVLGVSQGGLEPRWAIKWWPDIAGHVDDLVMHASPNHGTYYGRPPEGSFFYCFAACWQMLSGSSFLDTLNAGDETPAGPDYTSVFTQFDELVQPQQPVSTSALDGATNIRIQDICPLRPTEHLAISTADAVGFALAVDAFSHPGPADAARIDRAVCTKSWMDGTDPSKGVASPDSFSHGADAGWTNEEPALADYAS